MGQLRDRVITLDAALADAGARRRRALRLYERETELLRSFIDLALAEGYTVRHVADLTGLSFGRVGQMRRQNAARGR